jgi:predicted dehydrogenase
MNRRQFLAVTAASVPVLAFGAEAGRKLRVGVVGHTGRGDFGHGLDTMWASLPDTEIVAVADAVADGLEAAKKKLKVEQGFADYRRMLEETKPDIVAICSRHADQHRDMIVTAAEMGVRGAYVEKPFCRTPGEADEIVAACQQHNFKCAVAHRNTWHPALPVIKKLIEDGAIGKLLEIRGRGKEDDRGGPEDLWVLGSHAVSITNLFTGRATACTAELLTDGRPAAASDVRQGGDAIGAIAGNELHARWETESGTPVFFDSVKRAGTPAGFGIQFIGNNGLIDVRIDQPSLAHLCEGSPFKPTDQPRAWTPITTAGVGKPEPIANLREQIASHAIPGRDLIAAIQENREPLCGAENGRETIEMIAATFASHRSGQRVTLPLKDREHPLNGWQ